MDIELTKLEKYLKKESEKKIKEGEISLWNKLEKIEEAAKASWTRPIIPHYVPWHLDTHPRRIIKIINELIYKWKLHEKKFFSVEGVFYLLSSVYLHDIGLQYYKVIEGLEGKDPNEINDNESKTIRTLHAKTTAKIIKNYNELATENKIIEKVANALDICKEYLDVFGFMCEGHYPRIEEDKLRKRVLGKLEQDDNIWKIDDAVMNGYDWWMEEGGEFRKEELIRNLALLQTADTLDMTIERIAGDNIKKKEYDITSMIKLTIEPYCKLKALAFYYVENIEITEDKQILIEYAIPENMNDKVFRMLRLYAEGLRLKREKGNDCLSILDKDAEILLKRDPKSKEKQDMPQDVCDVLQEFIESRYLAEPKQKGRVLKKDFQDKNLLKESKAGGLDKGIIETVAEKLINKLSEGKIIHVDLIDDKYVHFNHKIDGKDQLRRQLEKICPEEVEQIVGIWEQSRRDTKSYIFNEHQLPNSCAHLYLLLYHELYSPNADYRSDSIIRTIIKDEKLLDVAIDSFRKQGVLIEDSLTDKDKNHDINNVLQTYKYKSDNDDLIGKFIKKYH